MSVRSEALLTTKPASTSRETCMRAAALTKSCYLALYRKTLLEPAWRGVKKPDWCMYQSVFFEVRLYGHHGDRSFQLLFRVDNNRNRGKTLASAEFSRWRDLLAELAAKDAARFSDAALYGRGLDKLKEAPSFDAPEASPLNAAALAVAEPNDAELGAKLRELVSSQRQTSLCDRPGCGHMRIAHHGINGCCLDQVAGDLCECSGFYELDKPAGLDLGVKHRLIGREALNFDELPTKAQVNRSGETVASEGPPREAVPATLPGAGTGGTADDLPPPMPESLDALTADVVAPRIGSTELDAPDWWHCDCDESAQRNDTAVPPGLCCGYCGRVQRTVELAQSSRELAAEGGSR